MQLLTKIRCMALALVCSLCQAEAGLLYQWDPVPHAVSYVGKVDTEKGPIFFRTSGTKILLKEAATNIQISAYGARGHLLQKKSPRPMDLDLSPVAHPFPFPLLKPPSTEPATKEDSKEPAGKEFLFSRTPYRYLSVYLGAGQENLRASNLNSNYSGKADLGNSGLALQITLTPRSSLSANVHVYPFSTSTQVNQTEEITAVRRSYLTAAYMYRLDTLSLPHTSIQVGAGAFELPFLMEPQMSGDTPALRSIFVGGPYVGILYLRPLGAFPALSLGGMLTSIPILFGSTSGMSLEASGQALFFPVDNVYLTGALLYRYQKITGSIDCPRQKACQETAQTKSDLYLTTIGIGLFF